MMTRRFIEGNRLRTRLQHVVNSPGSNVGAKFIKVSAVEIDWFPICECFGITLDQGQRIQGDPALPDIVPPSAAIIIQPVKSAWVIWCGGIVRAQSHDEEGNPFPWQSTFPCRRH